MDAGTVGRVAITIAVLIVSLGLVTWRQSRALEAYGQLAELRRQVAVAQAERIDLERTILVLESRGRVVPVAQSRLGMHLPVASEQVFLPAEPGS